MKGKIIVPNQSKNYNWISALTSFVIGIVLVTNSNQIVTFAFQIIGALIAIFGIFRLIRFFNIKKQFKTEDNNALISGIISITIGLLIILLASVIEIGLRYVIGIFLLLNGINKLGFALARKDNKKLYITTLLESILLILFGLYTIFFANAALIIIGVLLIASATIDLFSLVINKRN